GVVAVGGGERSGGGEGVGPVRRVWRARRLIGSWGRAGAPWRRRVVERAGPGRPPPRRLPDGRHATPVCAGHACGTARSVPAGRVRNQLVTCPAPAPAVCC